MKIHSVLFLLVTGMVLHACSPDTNDSPTRGALELGVCASEAALVNGLTAEFQNLYRETRIHVQRLHPDTAVMKFVNGSLAAIVLDRELDAAERAAVRQAAVDIQAVRVGTEGIAVLVPSGNKLTALTIGAVDSIITGRAADWTLYPQAGLATGITVCVPEGKTGIYRYLWKRFELVKHSAPRVLSYASAPELHRYLKTYPGAIAFSDPGILDSIAADAHALRLGWVDSVGTRREVPLHQAHVYEGTYPLTIPVMYYFRGGMDHVGAGMAAFISSNPGQTIVLKSGRAPASIPVRVVHLNPSDGGTQ